MTEFEETRRALEEFGVHLASLRREARAGATIDFEGLPERTETLCARVLALPAEEGRELAAHLSVLVNETAALADGIRADSRRLMERIQAADPNP